MRYNYILLPLLVASFCAAQVVNPGSSTNAAPGSGTLTTVGLVANQGTGSGSWFALFSPLTQTY